MTFLIGFAWELLIFEYIFKYLLLINLYINYFLIYDIKFILHEYQKVNILDKILQQILQVIGEGLSSPEAIVNHIWPYPYTQRA